MTTELYLVNDKNDFSNSFYTLISVSSITNNKCQIQIIPLRESPVIPIIITDIQISPETVESIIISQISLNLNCDADIIVQECNLLDFLKLKFSKEIENILKLSLDETFKEKLRKSIK